MTQYINLLIEDDLHLNVINKLLQGFSSTLAVGKVFGRRGKSFIKQNLKAYNQAAQFSPYLVLVDLDRTECPPTLLHDWLSFQKSNNLIFRVAVREAEAWLISDRDNLASFLGVSKNIIAPEPEKLPDPKEYIIALARRSRKRRIREDLIPQGQATVGRNYNTCLAEFIFSKWDVKKAMKHSESLAGLMRALGILSGRHGQ